MTLEKITREEFDKRLDATNERRTQELQQVEEQQAKTKQLLSYYERTLDEIEAELNAVEDSAPLPVRKVQCLRQTIIAVEL